MYLCIVSADLDIRAHVCVCCMNKSRRQGTIFIFIYQICKSARHCVKLQVVFTIRGYLQVWWQYSSVGLFYCAFMLLRLTRYPTSISALMCIIYYYPNLCNMSCPISLCLLSFQLSGGSDRSSTGMTLLVCMCVFVCVSVYMWLATTQHSTPHQP